MLRDLGLAQAEEPGGVVVENRGLLFQGEVRRVDAFYSDADRLRPNHLIRTEHDFVSHENLFAVAGGGPVQAVAE